ncbi:MAG: flagellar protein FlgN [Piscirickettsiaceae bacterium]|nr:flagellar protein FlgN [Piscirickettsiaceae bacterium]
MAITSFQQLSSVLQEEYNIASQLLVILNSERDALVKSETEIMDKMSADKQPLIVKLEQLGRQRELIVQADGFSSGKAGLDAFITNQNEANTLQLNTLLKQLRVVAQACRENNQINGGIVNVNRQYLHKAISLLRGRDTEITSYGPGGAYSSQVVRQPLLGRV